MTADRCINLWTRAKALLSIEFAESLLLDSFMAWCLAMGPPCNTLDPRDPGLFSARGLSTREREAKAQRISPPSTVQDSVMSYFLLSTRGLVYGMEPRSMGPSSC